jgi:HD-GYP domain-containing protein (c-di-GMP phosphodiesterase class II)
MNGSGYPFGLRGKDILLEARILGVADVFEAMTSHRPYRPTLGIENATYELYQNSGILYDGDVVEACLRIFKNRLELNCIPLSHVTCSFSTGNPNEYLRTSNPPIININLQ